MGHENGGTLLVEVLREAGVDTVFGVVSVHNLPLVQAVDAALDFVPVRGEAAAVNAADGYGRARGGIGCAITSTGTGAGNAAGSLVESLTAGVPLLHVTGQIELAYLGSGRGVIHETKDQLGMLAAVSKSAVTLVDAISSARTLREAVRVSLAAPAGPVSLEWPIDLQYMAQYPEQSPLAAAAGQPASAVPGLDEAAGLLATARRPVIWAGGGAVRAGAQLGELVRRLRAGLFTSNAGRGVVAEDDPLVVGNYGSSPAGRALLAEADVILSIGTHFRSNETADYALELPDAHVQIDVDPAALGRVYPAKVGLAGDAAALLTEIVDRLPEPSAAEEGWPLRVARVRQDARSAQRAAVGPQAVICDAIRAVLPRPAIVARDVTIPVSTWGNRLLEIYDPRSNIYARGGGIGQGLSMGLGAAIGRPDVPTLVIAGDGGFMVQAGELATLAQQRPWLTLLVFNDGGYGVLRNTQEHYFGKRAGVDLLTPDFRLLAASYGIPYALLNDAAEAEEVLASAVARRAPTLVEVDVEAIGEMARPFTPPVHIPRVPEVGGSRG